MLETNSVVYPFLNHINIIKIAQIKSHITLRLLRFVKELTKYKNPKLKVLTLKLLEANGA